MDYSKLKNIQMEGIDHHDYPDYCDAFITEADYDGRPLTEYELEILNEDRCFVYEQVMSYLY